MGWTDLCDLNKNRIRINRIDLSLIQTRSVSALAFGTVEGLVSPRDKILFNPAISRITRNSKTKGNRGSLVFKDKFVSLDFLPDPFGQSVGSFTFCIDKYYSKLLTTISCNYINI